MVTANQALKAVGLFIACLLKSITDLFLTKPLWASLKVLEDTDLRATGGIHETYKAKALWEKTGAVIMVVRRPGCLLCREELSSLKPQLEELGIPLLAVFKENIGQELDAFKTFFTGEVYVDQKRALYGPVEHYIFLSALLRIGVWRSLWRANRKGCTGNIIKGEGLLLGRVFVIGPEDQGILLEHREKEFGDKVNPIQDGLATAK
ncbi:peroxiredoxin-like 2A [Salvelinus fontinalis]|uniref:peroxiredoxin-like 2A n=1 Tax=Salvelinus fontinalis TaxID=8038 RepID=UPI0024853F9A|nr:peroxiredoxin-like 2A [Salvelinus fontinalis]